MACGAPANKMRFPRCTLAHGRHDTPSSPDLGKRYAADKHRARGQSLSFWVVGRSPTQSRRSSIPRETTKSPKPQWFRDFRWSGWPDLNRRPLDPDLCRKCLAPWSHELLESDTSPHRSSAASLTVWCVNLGQAFPFGEKDNIWTYCWFTWWNPAGPALPDCVVNRLVSETKTGDEPAVCDEQLCDAVRWLLPAEDPGTRPGSSPSCF